MSGFEAVKGLPAAPALLTPSRAAAATTTETRAGSRGAEPPLVSVSSLPVARGGQPAALSPFVHANGGAPASPHERFVPAAAFAFNFQGGPLTAAPSNVAAATPAAAPVQAPEPAPVSPPAQAMAPAPKEAPPVAQVAPPPPVATPAAPPPKPRFAPGSLEDQIQKAVEAEEAKKGH